MSVETAALCENRRRARTNLLKSPDQQDKSDKYKSLNRQVKAAVKKEKENNFEKRILQLEEYNNRGRRLYEGCKKRYCPRLRSIWKVES